MSHRSVQRRAVRTGASLLLALAAVAGCTREPTPPLRVGIPLWTGFAPAFLAWNRGWLGDTAHIHLIEFDSPAPARTAYRDGALDALGTTLDYALLIAEERPGTRIVLVLDVSHGGDGIVGRPGMTGAADLRGRRVAVESSTLGQYVLQRALERAGLTTSDVTIVTMEVREHEPAFAANVVDAVVTFEPTRTRLLQLGGVEIFSSVEIPGEIVDVLITDATTLATRAPELTRFAEGWYRARTELARDPDGATQAVAARLGLTPAQLREALARTLLPDAAAGRRLLSGEDSTLTAAERRVGRILRDAMVIQRDPALGRLNDTRLHDRLPARASP